MTWRQLLVVAAATVVALAAYDLVVGPALVSLTAAKPKAAA